MIIIKDKTIEKGIIIPSNWPKNDHNSYTIVIRNTTNKNSDRYNVVDESETDVLNYTFNMDFSFFADGEYEYTLINSDDLIVGTGLIGIGLRSLTKTSKKYTENIKYKSYDAR